MDKKTKRAPSHAAAKAKPKAKSKPRSRKNSRYSRRVRIVTVAGVCVMGLIAVLCIGVGGFVWNLLSKPQYIPDGGSLVESIPPTATRG